MKKILAVAALSALTAGCMADERIEAQAAAETQDALAMELRGRTAGEPRSCVNLRDLRGNRSVGDAVLFESTSRLVYVNRPPGGCPQLGSGRALKLTTPTGQLCRGEIVTVFDPVSGIQYGSCGLGDFIPYRQQG